MGAKGHHSCTGNQQQCRYQAGSIDTGRSLHDDGVGCSCRRMDGESSWQG